MVFRRGGVRSQQPQHTGVVGENVRVAVQHQKALAHIFRNGGELLLLLTQRTHLLGDDLILVVDLPQQGGELVIHIVVRGVVQVQPVDGGHNLLCQEVGEENGEHGHYNRRADDPGQHGEHSGKDGVGLGRHPQDLAVFQPDCVVIGLL